jgi:hypothetical protein
MAEKKTHAPERAMDQKIAFRWVLNACRRVMLCSEASPAAASLTASIPKSLTISSSALVTTFSLMLLVFRWAMGDRRPLYPYLVIYTTFFWVLPAYIADHQRDRSPEDLDERIRRMEHKGLTPGRPRGIGASGSRSLAGRPGRFPRFDRISGVYSRMCNITGRMVNRRLRMSR